MLNNPSCSFFFKAKLILKKDKKVITKPFMDKSKGMKIKIVVLLDGGGDRSDENGGQVASQGLKWLRAKASFPSFSFFKMSQIKKFF
jgi:hypothetical protein